MNEGGAAGNAPEAQEAMKEITVSRKLHRDQRGITLIEMTVAIALIGLIAAGIAMTISQVMAVNSRTSSHMVALRQVQQAGDRVSKDVLQAGSVVPNSHVDPFSLRLTIPSWTHNATGGLESSEYTVKYWLEGEELRREYDDGESTPIITTVARYIVSTDPDTGETKTSFLPGGEAGSWVFTVTARSGLQTETRVYDIKQRPGS